MTHDRLKIGSKVLYIPRHLLSTNRDEMIKTENLGVVTRITYRFIFVKYVDSETSKPTEAIDLYSIDNRPDLLEVLNKNLK